MSIKRISSWFAGLLAVIAVWFGVTQGPANQAVLTATAPTTNVDGSVLNDLTSIRVYRKKDAGAYSVLVTSPYDVEGGTFTYTDQNLVTGTYCYKLTAIRATGAESALSNESCKALDLRTPSAPTNLTVQ